MKMNLKSTHGFTLIEMLIVTAVFAIVLTMAFPSFTLFFELQKEQSEEVAMDDLREALDAYSRALKKVPEEADWDTELAKYSNLTPTQIKMDIWGNERIYKKITEIETFRGASVDAGYAVIYSYGADNCYGLDCDATDTFDSNVTFTDRTDYEGLTAEDGDYIVKYSTYKNMVADYKETLERMDKISQALVSYSQSMLSEMVIAVEADPVTYASHRVENYFYYPPSAASGDVISHYSENVRADVDRITGGSDYRIEASPTDSIRRTNMIALMRVLGLPDSYCCSSLELGTDDLPLPFYYYSNPRARTASTCSARPVGTSTRKLPPRLSAEADTCG